MKPRYLQTLDAQKMNKKVEKALSLLEKPCRVCPHECPVSRMDDDKGGKCRTGRWASLSNFGTSFDLETRIAGWKGSGVLTFSKCSLECAFCQKLETGFMRTGKLVKPDEIAGMMIELQTRGCHNISLVNPSHIVPQIVEALTIAIGKGLKIPLVYVSCGFDSEESLAVLDGLVDVYVVEFRFWNEVPAQKLTFEKDYAQITRKVVWEMHRQVGDLKFDDHSMAVSGLLVRHLVMPHDLAGTNNLMRFLAKEVSRETYVNMLASYEPVCRASEFPEINRPITFDEYQRAVQAAYQAGLQRLDTRETAF